MKITLYPHGGSGNHGCEAIVRSTAKILDHCTLDLFSKAPDQDINAGLDKLCTIYKAEQVIRTGSWPYLKAKFKHYILRNKQAYDEAIFGNVIENAKKSDYVLGIGGDNYCYGAPTYIYLINRILDRAKIKRVLWGCSIEPTAIDKKMFEDLKGYHKIWARESLTYDTLRNKGLEQTILMPDPAFLLKRIDLPLPDGFIEGNTVGINVSPMIINLEGIQGLTLENYIQLINYIINHTDMQVALIPHVVWKSSDDRKPLNLLYDKFKNTGRICMIEDHNAEELKGYIARCRFMIAARTHASIAAYSQKIPTLVVGYSIKAQGIARDIFGVENNYVYPVQSFQNPTDLTNGFIWLMKNEYFIKDLYDTKLDSYISKIHNIL